MSKVIVLLTAGFEEIEAITVVDVLRRANIEVVLGALEALHVKGAHGVQIIADALLSDIDTTTFDMVVLPGGLPGATNLAKDTRVIKLLQDFDAKGKAIAAICAAPLALKVAGVLKNHYTCYPSFENHIQHEGYTPKSDVVCDENITTSRGPSTAMNFALSLVETLCSIKVVQNLEKDLLLR